FHAMALFGFNNVLPGWWDAKSINPNHLDQNGLSPLGLASLGSCLNVMKKLFELGADVNMQLSSRRFGSALAAAAAVWNNQDTVQLLLDSGADINMQLSSGEYGSALEAAVVYERKDSLQL